MIASEKRTRTTKRMSKSDDDRDQSQVASMSNVTIGTAPRAVRCAVANRGIACTGKPHYPVQRDPMPSVLRACARAGKPRTEATCTITVQLWYPIDGAQDLPARIRFAIGLEAEASDMATRMARRSAGSCTRADCRS